MKKLLLATDVLFWLRKKGNIETYRTRRRNAGPEKPIENFSGNIFIFIFEPREIIEST
jgi:hypothetical protein